MPGDRFRTPAEVHQGGRQDSSAVRVAEVTQCIVRGLRFQSLCWQIAWKGRRHIRRSRRCRNILRQLPQFRCGHARYVVEGCVDDSVASPEKHTIVIRRAALANVFLGHARLAIKRVGAVSSGRIFKSDGAHLKLVGIAGVVTLFKFFKSIILQRIHVCLVSTSRLRGGLSRHRHVPARKVRRQDCFCRRRRSGSGRFSRETQGGRKNGESSKNAKTGGESHTMLS